MPQIDTNGLTFEYDTFGSPTDEPVLLIMGLGAQMTAWSLEFCNALVEKGHYVVRFDNRDVGLSSKFDGVAAPGRLRYAAKMLLNVPLGAPYSIADMAIDAVGILDQLDIDSAHIVGASMGGMIAQHLAFSHAPRVRSLTSLMSSSGRRNLPRASPEVTQHMFMARPDGSDVNASIEHSIRTLKLIGSPAYPRSDGELRLMITTMMNRSSYRKGFERQLAALVDDGSRASRLRSVRSPTLVIHGSHDPLVPVECGRDTARYVPGARLEIIEGMGHDMPPELVGKLTTLIAEHTQSSAQDGQS